MEKLDWKKDKYVTKWLQSRKGKTRVVYEFAFKKFFEFTKKTPTQLIMEKWKDTQREPIKRTDVAELQLLKFFESASKKESSGVKLPHNASYNLRKELIAYLHENNNEVLNKIRREKGEVK